MRARRCLTDDVRVVDFLQELRLLVEALLVNAFLFAGTFAVDLLDSPGRRIQLFRPGNQWGREWEGWSFFLVLLLFIVCIKHLKVQCVIFTSFMILYW